MNEYCNPEHVKELEEIAKFISSPRRDIIKKGKAATRAKVILTGSRSWGRKFMLWCNKETNKSHHAIFACMRIYKRLKDYVDLFDESYSQSYLFELIKLDDEMFKNAINRVKVGRRIRGCELILINNGNASKPSKLRHANEIRDYNQITEFKQAQNLWRSCHV